MLMRLPVLLVFAAASHCGVAFTCFAQNETVTRREDTCLSLIRAFDGRARPRDELAERFREHQPDLIAWAKEHPKNVLIHYATGLAYLLNDDVESSLPFLKTAYDGSQYHAKIGANYSLALQLAMKPVESLRVAGELTQKHPDDLRLRFAYGMQLMGVQKYEAGVEAFKMVLEQLGSDKERAITRGLIGRCQLYLGQHKDAIENITAAEAVDPDDVRRLVPLAEAYLKSGDDDSAKDVLRRVLKINEDYAHALFLTGVILEREGKASASRYFRDALESGEKGLVQDNGRENYLLYQICTKLGLSAKADRYKKQAARLQFTFEPPWAAGLK